MLLSIIIPVYNSRKDIEICLNSIWEQNLSINDFEVICVDDKSTDDSIVIIENLLISHSNLRLVKNDINRRAGGARNHGVQEASGEYILFIDADDYFHPGSLKTAIQHLKYNANLDILVCNFARELPGCPNDKLVQSYGTEEVSSIKDFISSGHIPYGPCQWFFRRKLMTDNMVWFRENCICEDVDWTHRLVLYARNIQYQPILLSHYVIRKGSQTALSYILPSSIYSYMKAGKELFELYNNYDSMECKEYIVNLSRSYIQQGLKYYLVSNDSLDSKVENIKLIIPQKLILNFPWNMAKCFPRFFSFLTSLAKPFVIVILKIKSKYSYRGLHHS